MRPAGVAGLFLVLWLLCVPGGRLGADEPTLADREAGLAADDADGRVALALWAWERRDDAASRRLAAAALAIDPSHEAAHRLLGHVRAPAGWVAGLAPPHGDAWDVGPRWGAEQRRATGRVGGSTMRKRAERALAWLAAHQDEDGRIDADAFGRHCPDGDVCEGTGGGHHGERMPCAFDGAVTAVAVLAWSAHGSTLEAGPYRASIASAIPFCERVIEAGVASFDSIWNVAFATEAVADVCAASRAARLRGVVERGVAELQAQQRPDGGYSYVYAIGDVPTTAVVLCALGQAAQAGIGVDAEAVSRALAFLDERVDPGSGRSEYHDGAEHKGYTPTRANAAAALAARSAVGALAATPALAAQLAAAREQKPRWKLEEKVIKTRDGRRVKAQVGSLYPFLWYLADRALLDHGGAAAAGWRRALRAALGKGQRADGHAAGSWDPRGPYSLSGGRAFVTGIGALMLLSIHRYPGRP